MAPTTSQSRWYVYGIVPSEPSPADLPAGLGGASVMLEPHDGVAALVSVFADPDYSPTVLETRTADVDWLGPRAVAHDQVLTWLSDRGPVIPFPMFSLFSGREAVQTMLRDQATQFRHTLAHLADGREYALRVYRVESELLGVIASLSPRLSELAASAAAASPGQRYLLERKLEGETKTELRAVTQSVVDEIVDTLTPVTRGVVRSPIPRPSDAQGARGTMVINAAFLVAPAGLEEFQKTLTSLVERRSEHGFRFDFTGPWPPYHFVNGPADGK